MYRQDFNVQYEEPVRALEPTKLSEKMRPAFFEQHSGMPVSANDFVVYIKNWAVLMANRLWKSLRQYPKNWTANHPDCGR